VNKLLIWGAGGHGKVVLDVVRAQATFTDIVFIDDGARISCGDFQGCRIVGDRTELTRLRALGYTHFVVAIGCNDVRAKCFRAAFEAGIEPATFIHPAAAVSRCATIAAGTVVMAKAVINAASVVGTNCIVNSGAIVEHDCILADHVHVAPGVVLGGGVGIGAYSLVGLNSSVLPGTEIGERAIVGAGTVVLANVAPGDTVVGAPARSLRQLATTDR